MKVSIEKFNQVFSEYSSTMGQKLYESKRLLVCCLTPHMLAGKIVYDYSSYFDIYSYIFIKIEFDDDDNIIQCVQSVCHGLNKDQQLAYIYAFLKFREAYMKGDNTYYQMDSIVENSCSNYDFDFFFSHDDIEFEYIPYKDKNYDKKFKESFISLDKNNKEYSKNVKDLIHKNIPLESVRNAKIDVIFNITYNLLKKDKNINVLYDILNSLKNRFQVDHFIKILVDKLNNQDTFANDFFFNIDSSISTVSFNYIQDLLLNDFSIIPNFNESFLLSILKLKLSNNINKEIIKIALSLEYLEIIKYILKNEIANINFLDIVKIVDILKRKVEPSSYFSIYEKRIRKGEISQEELYFLKQYLNDEQEEILYNHINENQNYWSIFFIPRNFYNYIYAKPLFKVEELDFVGLYSLRKELFDPKSEYYARTWKKFKILSNRELSTKYTREEYLYIIKTIIKENLDKPEMIEYLTCERTIEYLKKFPNREFLCFYRGIVTKANLLNEHDGYKKF